MPMYEAMQGILKEKEPLKAVVDVGGIFYRLSIPLSTYAQLPAIDAPVHLFLSHVVREDAHTLYAFLVKEERNLFEILISISGVGPKTAVGIIGRMEFDAFHKAITSADVRMLSTIPGIGKKTAERLVIELRDKIGGQSKDLPSPLCLGPHFHLGTDAISALVNLGYNPLDAQKAVAAALNRKKGETDLGNLIAAALQHI
ncbi:MAG TPA: Holliday junction branch migration protein RuvA [Chlamydiales bacterium]|nr:Holliday junction branch migration protein RuvA [Chlamydiales bacterium]